MPQNELEYWLNKILTKINPESEPIEYEEDGLKTYLSAIYDSLENVTSSINFIKLPYDSLSLWYTTYSYDDLYEMTEGKPTIMEVREFAMIYYVYISMNFIRSSGSTNYYSIKLFNLSNGNYFNTNTEVTGSTHFSGEYNYKVVPTPPKTGKYALEATNGVMSWVAIE